MWFSNAWNNFAPFAGFMLLGYKKKRPLEGGAKGSTKRSKACADAETTGNKMDDVPQ